MKKSTALIIAFFLTPLLVFSQNQAVKNFQEKYKTDRDATYIEVTGSLFKFIGSIAENVEPGEDDESTEDIEAMGRIANGIQSMKVLQIPKYESGLEEEEITQLKSSLEKDKYETLMTMKEGRKYVYVMAQGGETEIRNMLVLIDEKDEFTLMNIDGVLSTKDIAYLIKDRDKWHN